MDQIVISKPEKCHLWTALPTGEELVNAFEHVKTFRDDYHHTRDLKKCKACGQLYFCEFYEQIDFRDGDDREYYCFIPADSFETADKLNNLSRFALASLPGIFMNFPPYDSKPYWNNK